jgi:hypothetical protein
MFDCASEKIRRTRFSNLSSITFSPQAAVTLVSESCIMVAISNHPESLPMLYGKLIRDILRFIYLIMAPA